MHLYIFRDIYTGKLYKVHADTIRLAKDKVIALKNVQRRNLALVKPQEKVS